MKKARNTSTLLKRLWFFHALWGLLGALIVYMAVVAFAFKWQRVQDQRILTHYAWGMMDAATLEDPLLSHLLIKRLLSEAGSRHALVLSKKGTVLVSAGPMLLEAWEKNLQKQIKNLQQPQLFKIPTSPPSLEWVHPLWVDGALYGYLRWGLWEENPDVVKKWAMASGGMFFAWFFMTGWILLITTQSSKKRHVSSSV